jgi:hypothetical protein
MPFRLAKDFSRKVIFLGDALKTEEERKYL